MQSNARVESTRDSTVSSCTRNGGSLPKHTPAAGITWLPSTPKEKTETGTNSVMACIAEAHTLLFPSLGRHQVQKERPDSYSRCQHGHKDLSTLSFDQMRGQCEEACTAAPTMGFSLHSTTRSLSEKLAAADCSNARRTYKKSSFCNASSRKEGQRATQQELDNVNTCECKRTFKLSAGKPPVGAF